MTPSEHGEARRVLYRIGEQMDGGATPEVALRNAHRMCDTIRLPDRLLPSLLVAWLSSANGQGRDIAPMIGDAETLLTMFKATAP